MLAYALDMFGAEIFWNQSDITISGLCWLVMMADSGEHYPATAAKYGPRLASLKLYGWQLALLRHIGPRLDQIRPRHREKAREDDLARAQRVIDLLT